MSKRHKVLGTRTYCGRDPHAGDARGSSWAGVTCWSCNRARRDGNRHMNWSAYKQAQTRGRNERSV